MTSQHVVRLDPAPGPAREEARGWFRCLTSAVAVVTARGHEGTIGMTVSTLVSVSLDPPLVAFCARTGSATLAVLRQTGEFGISVLDETQVEHALAFAEGTVWDRGQRHLTADDDGDVPRLAQSPATALCDLESAVVAGDHVIVTGRLRLCAALSVVRPLVWHDGGFRGCRPVLD